MVMMNIEVRRLPVVVLLFAVLGACSSPPANDTPEEDSAPRSQGEAEGEDL